MVAAGGVRRSEEARPLGRAEQRKNPSSTASCAKNGDLARTRNAWLKTSLLQTAITRSRCYGRHAVWRGEFGFEYLQTPAKGTCPAGAYPQSASRYGALGMAANVAEWTASEEAESSSHSNRFVHMGGHWSLSARSDYISCKARNAHAGNYRDSLIGFRCVKSDERPVMTEVIGL